MDYPETPETTELLLSQAEEPWVDLMFLGGLGEIGLNAMIFETAESLVLVDAGIMFPEDYMLGIDMVIPDFSYLSGQKDKILALILTHGHEDHIGAVPFLLKEFDLPVYGTAMTLALLREKLKEHRLLEEARLQQHVLEDMPHSPPKLVEAILISALPQQADELPHPVTKHAKGHEGQHPQQDDAGQTERGDIDRVHKRAYPFRALILSVRAGSTSSASPTTP